MLSLLAGKMFDLQPGLPTFTTKNNLKLGLNKSKIEKTQSNTNKVKLSFKYKKNTI